MEFFTLDILTSYYGATLFVAIVVQLIKEKPIIKHVPTQLFSYIIAAITLILSNGLINGFTIPGVVLSAFNAVLVSLSANGGHDALKRIVGSVSGMGIEEVIEDLANDISGEPLEEDITEEVMEPEEVVEIVEENTEENDEINVEG